MRFLSTRRVIRLALVLFWLAAVFAVVMAAVPKPPETPIDRFGDKIAHIVAFAVLAALAMVAYGREARWKIAERLCFLGAAIEVIQTIPALHRSPDVRDWIADTVAVLVVVLLASPVVPARVPKSAPFS